MTPRLSLLCQLSQHGNDLRGKIVRPMQQQASHVRKLKEKQCTDPWVDQALSTSSVECFLQIAVH